MLNVTSSWAKVLSEEAREEYFRELCKGLEYEYDTYTCYPDQEDIFRAFTYFEASETKVIILGQDPYPNANQAHGLAFSVKDECSIPRSLQTIFKEVNRDLKVGLPETGNLERWAKQGVLLLNTYLTVRRGQPLSHSNLGWEFLTNRLIRKISILNKNLVFMLWGNKAKKKVPYISETGDHLILLSSHPSPLSSNKGFLGCGHFSKCNEFLESRGKEPIEW